MRKYKQIQDEFVVPISRSTVTQILVMAEMKQSPEARANVEALLVRVNAMANVEIMRVEIYTGLGRLWQRDEPRKAKEYFDEARRLLLLRLPEDDKRIKELDGIMKGMALKSVKSETQVLRGGQ